MERKSSMIKRMLDRCHVGESYETVIRYVISRMKNGFETYRELSIKDKAMIIEMVVNAHEQNREAYNFVMRGFK